MTFRNVIVIVLVLLFANAVLALEPEQILIIVNRQISESEQIANYYCEKRSIPTKNILYLALGHEPKEFISRKDYDNSIALPIRRKLQRLFPGEIRCLVTTYGVPIKVGPRGPLPGTKGRLKELERLLKQEKRKLEQLEQNSALRQEHLSSRKELINTRISKMKSEINRISGRETNASVDSELSMVLFQNYNLYRWHTNTLRNDVLGLGFKTLMVSRLDGQNLDMVKSLIDKALTAEQTGLKGTAYIDSRGIAKEAPYGHYDQSLRDLAESIRSNNKMPIIEEKTKELFAPDSCPETAIYCGWYSLRKYVDAFDFVDGAVGYHIASLEAGQLRDPNSKRWCPAMLKDGITATLGAVTEPYLHSFPEPKAFFTKLFNGACLVEAYYHTKPFNSWQLILIGDPLYKPFKKD